MIKRLVVIIAMLFFCSNVMAGGEETVAVPEYRFYKYQLEAGYYNRDLTNIYIHKQFTWPNVPIFWQGQTRAQKGALFSFEQNFFHTRKWFALDYGVDVGQWVSHVNAQDITTAAAYLAIKLWLYHGDKVQFYFTYSVAGPCYISQSIIDNRNMSSKFTFQDFMGLGAFFGTDRALEVSVKLLHFSNGYLVPQDPGYDVPIVFTLGYAFGV